MTRRDGRPLALALVVSCEHASAAVPNRFRGLLTAARIRRAGHGAVDFGAGAAASRFARALQAPCAKGRATRLLVDLNRSVHHPRLFSEPLRALPAARRAELLARYWRPYRERVEALVSERVAAGRVLHVSVHSFAPRLAGQTRSTDLALLYDHSRTAEHALARAWLAELRRTLPELRLHANQPYRGRADGFTTHLRRQHPATRYLGIELELNQRHLGSPVWSRMLTAAIDTLRPLLESSR